MSGVIDCNVLAVIESSQGAPYCARDFCHSLAVSRFRGKGLE